MKPEAVIPGVVTAQFLLARTEATAIAITGLSAYPTGFGFVLTAALRREDRRGQAFRHGLHSHWPGDTSEPLPDEFLRLGVRFADGSVATNLDRRALPPPNADPAGPILRPDGGGGGGRRYDMHYWVWPLPPPGPLTFVCQWPAHEIPESHAETDAQQILDAAGRAIRLWPDDGDASD